MKSKTMVSSLLLCILLLSAVACSYIVVNENEFKTFDGQYYSFQYPANWTIEASSTNGQYVVLYSPLGRSAVRNKIEIAYLSLELAEDEDFADWNEEYTRLAGHEPLILTILSADSKDMGNGEQQRRLHTRATTELGPAQTILITHGKLVLAVGTYTHDAAQTKILQAIAESLTFAADAPKTLVELSQP